MSTTIGYARASTEDQDCAIQVEALKAAGCNIIRSENKSGLSLAGRAELDLCLQLLRESDTLLVTRIDRLARSVRGLERIIDTVREKRAFLRATEQPVDTSTAAGKAFLQMLGVFAEFETALRRERQLEGIAKAKAQGVYKGRKPTVDPVAVRRLRDAGVGASEIAKQLGIGRASVYRALDA